MARLPRSRVFDRHRSGVYHCTQRCVRRAFLCGEDEHSGNNYEHRRGWIRDLLGQLAAIFAFEIMTYSVMSNHLHTVVRNRPDLADKWSAKEVAWRWWQLYPKRRNKDGTPAAMTDKDLKMMTSDPHQVEVWRERLKDISWLMKSLAEPIARLSNAEDGVTGRFWEGRFRCQELADEGALLACCIYVDLNPLRANLAESIEKAIYTSLYDRLRAEAARSGRGPESDAQADAWLAPLQLDPREKAPKGPSRSGLRISDHGFLEMTLEEYCELAKWTFLNTGKSKSGPMPEKLERLLRSKGLVPEHWCYVTERYMHCFGRCVGRAESVQAVAELQQVKWIRGISQCRRYFAD